MLKATTGMPASLQPDPLADMIVVNALGFMDEVYGPPPSGPRTIVSPGGLAAAKSSGLTAINMSLPGSDSFEGAVEGIARYDAFIRANSTSLLKVQTAGDIRRAKAERKIGMIYGFQNATMLGDKAERVEIFANLGARCIQLTYNLRNQLGSGAMDTADQGLTPFGREVVARLNAQRVMVDLSHSGRQICLDAARASTTPISINHTGCRALSDVPRNKTDEELKLVADRGGFIGIYFMMFLARGREATIDDVVAHIRHAIKVCGEDHVGFGTDYGLVELGDMAGVRAFWGDFVRRRLELKTASTGEDPAILPFANGLVGPNQFRNLFRAMDKAGLSTGVIEKVLGLNYLRFASAIWGA
ncbi:MAG: dipeptidase [Gemmatimonadales bacterium]